MRISSSASSSASGIASSGEIGAQRGAEVLVFVEAVHGRWRIRCRARSAGREAGRPAPASPAWTAGGSPWLSIMASTRIGVGPHPVQHPRPRPDAGREGHRGLRDHQPLGLPGLAVPAVLVRPSRPGPRRPGPGRPGQGLRSRSDISASCQCGMVIEPTAPCVNDSRQLPYLGSLQPQNAKNRSRRPSREIAASSEMTLAHRVPGRDPMHQMNPDPSCPANPSADPGPGPPRTSSSRAPRRAGRPPSGASLAQPLQVAVQLDGRHGGLEPERDGSRAARGSARTSACPGIPGQLERAVPHPCHVPLGDVPDGPEHQREPGVRQILYGRAVVHPLPGILRQH